MAGDTVSERVRELAEHHDIDESEVFQRALETGVERLYRDLLVSRYLAEEISLERAVEALGADVVDDVDSAREAIEDDVAWGLRA